MKNIIKALSLLLCAVILFLLLPSCGKKEQITFMIANDLHYLSPTLLGDGKFFSEPQTRSDGKLVHRSAEIADELVAEAIEKKPQALILAGDLTLNGALASHTELSAKLMKVKEAGIDVLVIPGNHDIGSTAVDYSGSELVRAESVDAAKYIELYSPLIPERAISRDEYSQSYIYEASEKLRIVMLDTNTFGSGFANDRTLEWLEFELKTACEKGIDVISVTHQNLYAHSDLLSFGYQLYNADKLLSLYTQYGVRANFSAHIHIQSILENDIPEIATSAISVAGLHYAEIGYDGKSIDYSACSLSASAELSEYAGSFFTGIALDQARDELSGSGLPSESVELMAKTYAEINTAYFSGAAFDLSSYTEGIELWRSKSDSFIAKYIDSMTEEKDGNLSIEIDLNK